MTNIRQTQYIRNTLQLPNCNCASLRGARSIRAFIVLGLEPEMAYFAIVIYAGTWIAHHFNGWLGNISAERAWLHLLSLAYEWRDRNAPNSRLYIIQAPSTKAEGRHNAK